MTDHVELAYAHPISLDQLQSVALDGATVTLSEDGKARIAHGRDILRAALESGTRVYGLNTGLGHTRDEDIPQEVLDRYQVDIVLSHSFGVGDPLPAAEVRAIMTARAAGAVRGYSGLSLPVVSMYTALLNAGIVPVVPREGSIGASDLGTLAAVAATMIGHGYAFLHGERMPARVALERAGLTPVTLGLKEGLGVVSENSYSIGVGTLALGEIARTLRLADVAAALTMEANRSSLTPFDPEVAVARPFRGQAAVGRRVMALLEGSYLTDPAQALSLQDPLSIRTVAQVHGAALTMFRRLAADVQLELNASDDNPMTSPDSRRALSTGNFHPMEIALGFDSIRIALGHIALISERRAGISGHQLWSSLQNDAPTAARFVSTPGIGGYANAAMLARVRTLANPVTLNVPSLDMGQEDHATAAPLAVDFTRQVTAIVEEMLVGEITAASAVISRGDDVPLGIGTRPYYEAVLDAWDEGDEFSFGADLIARVGAKVRAMTSRRIEVLDAASDVSPESTLSVLS